MNEFTTAKNDSQETEKVPLFHSMSATGPPPLVPDKSYVNAGTDDQMEVSGYRRNGCKTAIVWIFIILTIGFLRLVFYWKPHWMLLLTHDEESLETCSSVILRNHYKQVFVSQIDLVNTTDIEDYGSTNGHGRCFRCKKMVYIWESESQQFIQITGLRTYQMRCSQFRRFEIGLTHAEQEARRVFYGQNAIEVHVRPVVTLLFQEVLNPFYVFQLFTVCLWIADQYYYYSMAIVFMSVISIIATVYQTRKIQRQLKRTISSSTIVSVKSLNEGRQKQLGIDDLLGVIAEISTGYEMVHSELLVPGDIISIPRSGCIMQCDAVLITGSCIVNESMLTGESVPVTKTPLPTPEDDPIFSFHSHAAHVLFSGTQVLQTRLGSDDTVKALVLRTGFSTSKGELVRAIMYPKPIDFKFERDSYYFIVILASLAAVGFVYTVTLMVLRGEAASEIVIRALDLFTIAVPPALPAAMTIGIMHALIRLKRSGIYCISPRSISVCGAINAVCFDKTGTLTEDGLDFHSMVLASRGMFQQSLQNAEQISDLSTLECMATCHSLAVIDGVISGDPLDLIMFRATGWSLEEPTEVDPRFGVSTETLVHPPVTKAVRDTGAVDVGVIRQFTFSSELQRMSVVTLRCGQGVFNVYTKGAPEMVASLCNPDTVPHNFPDVLRVFTQKGYRVLALAMRQLPEAITHTQSLHISRENVEKDLTFLGLLVMENRLKPETSPVIQKLKAVDIRTIMVTGDNILTAVSVAQKCGMVSDTQQIIFVNAVPIGSSGEYTLEFQTSNKPGKISKNPEKQTVNRHQSITIGQEPSYSFAIPGSTWSVLTQHFPHLIPKILMRCSIFARMSPEQKAQVVRYLQELEYYVCMCGDGTNDCGALKAAHAGIALTEAEASVASPFTASRQNISCVPVLIKNGRCALVTSVGIFKYMALYSIIQFTSVCLLYWISANHTDFGFLYIDLALLTPFSILFGRTGTYPKLVKGAPSASLISLSPILSLFLHTLLQGLMQVLAYIYVRVQPWHTPYEGVGHDYKSHENATIFLFSCYQYIIMAIVFSKGAPYRKSIFRNYLLMLNTIVSLAFTIYITVGDPDTVPKLEIKPIPHIEFKLLIVGFAGIHFFLAMLLESNIVDSHFVRVTLQDSLNKCRSSSQYAYETLDDQLRNSPDWLPETWHDPVLVEPSGDNFVDGEVIIDEKKGGLGNFATNGNFSLTVKTPHRDNLELQTLSAKI